MSKLFKYIILPVFLIVAAAVMVFWVILPLWKDIQFSLELKNGNADNLAQRKKLTANLQRLISQYNDRASDLTSFNEVIPVGENIPELLVNLEALASENNLIFSGVNFKPADSKNPNVKTLAMEISLKGSYTSFQNYLRAMEKSLRLFDVISISFSGVSPGQTDININDLMFNLIVNTYYQ